MAIILMAGIMTSLTAQALTVTGTLGTASFSADAWTFACPTGTTRVQMRVKDGRNPINTLATVYASYAEDGSPTLTAADTDSDDIFSSWIINTSDGPGNYILVLRKVGSNMEDYAAEMQCLNSLGALIGPSSTSVKSIHNQ